MLLDSGSDLSWLRSAEFEKLGGKVEWAGRLKIVYANGDEERIPTERKTICVTITHPELSKVIMRVQVYKQRAIKGQDYVLTIGRACMGANNVLYAPCEDGLIRSQALFRRKGRPGYAPEYLVGSETIRAMVRMVEKGESVKEWLIRQYPKVFAENYNVDINDPQKAVHVSLKDNAVPKRVPPMRLSHQSAEQLEKIVQQLVREGKLERSTSPFLSPAFLVPKPGRPGEWRMVVDYRRINEQTVALQYPLRRVQEILLELHGDRLFTSIDLRDGFWQLWLDEESRDVLAVTTQKGSYRWVSLPMGWHSSPAAFQAYMDRLFAHVPDVHIYQDDLIVATEASESVHVTKLREVFEILDRNNLKVKPSKVQVMVRQLDILGFHVADGYLHPTVANTVKIVEFNRPQSRRDLREFMGSLNFYKALFPDWNELTHPLSRMLTERVPFAWGKLQDAAFEKIQSKLRNRELRVFIPNPAEPFTLFTDSSQFAAGAALFQGSNPVGYFHKGYTEAERRYHSNRLELKALHLALRHWRMYLEHNRTVAFVDNAVLSTLLTKGCDKLSNQERNIIEELSTYQLDIRHVQGIRNNLADYLSRRTIRVLDGCAGSGGLLEVLTSMSLACMVEYQALETCGYLREHIQRLYHKRYANSTNLHPPHKDGIFRWLQDIQSWSQTYATKLGLEYQKFCPIVDFFSIGFPCQPYSVMGEGRGAADTRGLHHVVLDMLKRLLAANPSMLFCIECTRWHPKLKAELENFDKEIASHGGRKYMVRMERFSPQNRTRQIWTNIDISGWDQERRKLNWQDCLDPGRSVQQQTSPCLMASKNTQSQRDGSALVTDDKTGKKVPMRLHEMERIQGFPEGFTEGMSDDQRHRTIGNAIPAQFHRWMLKQVMPTMTNPSTQDSQRWYTKFVNSHTSSNKNAGQRLAATAPTRKRVMKDEEFEKVAKAVHESLHCGPRQQELLMKDYWDLTQVKDVRERLAKIKKECPACQLADTPANLNQQYHGIAQRRQYESVACDWVSVPTTARQKKQGAPDQFATFTEQFSRYILIVPCSKKQTAKELAAIYVEKCMPFFGIPEKFQSDQDVRTTSTYWKKFAEEVGMACRTTTSYAPWADGVAENTNKKVLKHLVKQLLASPTKIEWKCICPIVQDTLNSLPNQATGLAPRDIIFRRPPISVAIRSLLTKEERDELRPVENPAATTFANELKWVEREVRRRQEAYIQKLESKRNRGPQFKVGDRVKFVLHRNAAKDPKGKLSARFRGPAVIVKSTGRGAYRLRYGPHLLDRNGRFVAPYHGKETVPQIDYDEVQEAQAEDRVVGIRARDWKIVPPKYLVQLASRISEWRAEEDVPECFKYSILQTDERNFNKLGHVAWGHRKLLENGVKPKYTNGVLSKGSDSVLYELTGHSLRGDVD